MSSSNYMQLIVDYNYKNWPVLYQNVGQIIDELEELISNNGMLSYEIKNKIFWFFRNYFSSDKNQLSKISAKKLYDILMVVLQQDRCFLNLEDNDLSILEDLLIVLERIFYLHPDLSEEVAILNPLIKAVTFKKNLNITRNAGAFISALLNCFKTFLSNRKITKSVELIHLTQALQEFFVQQLVWSKKDPVAMLVKGLFFLKDLRCNYKENLEIRSVIDRYAIKLCDMAIHDIPKIYPYYPINFIQEDIGASYIKYLETEYRSAFNGLYKVLYPEDVLPEVKIHTMIGNINLPAAHIKINHTELSSERSNNMEDLISELHSELRNFLNSSHIKCLEPGEIHIQLNLFKDQQQFERYGYLVWNVDSSGGGICIPAMNNQPTTAFVYQIDQGFQNLKHELTHAFMNNILGDYYTEYLSGVFTEGIADFFDKGPSNLNKLMQMQRLLLREPLKALPDIVTLNEGGSIVYLYGYFLMVYLIQEKLVILSKILTEVQNKNQNQMTKLIEFFSLKHEDDFKEWMENKLSQLIIFLFKAIREQDRGNVNQLLAGMNNQQVNIQENASKDTPLHIAIEIWMQQKNDASRTIALNIIWSLLLKGAELRNVRNTKGKSPFDLIENAQDRELIERYAKDAKHYIDLENITYTEKTLENITIC